MDRTHLRVAAGVIAALTISALSGAPTAVAGKPRAVDPSTVTPALNPDFAPYVCTQNGAGILCTGGSNESYDDTTDIPCAGGWVHVTGHAVVSIQRWHDPEGRALSTTLHTSYDDELSLAPGGPHVTLFAHWQKHYDYPVPGDASQRVLRETGAILRVRGIDGGTVFQDTGFVQYLPDEEYEGVDVEHGVHDRYTGPDLYAAICDALLNP